MRSESQGLRNSATRLTASEAKSEAKLIAFRRLPTDSVQNGAPAGIGHKVAVK